MQIEFITDLGFRIAYENKSLVLASCSIGKVGEFLSDREIINFSKALSHYDSGVGMREKLPFKKVKITPVEAPRVSDDVAFKFTDDNGLAHWLQGSIKLSPPATYLTIENPHAQDLTEGRGFVYLQGRTRFATLTSLSGFNALIICTSTDARKSERIYRSGKFGQRIVKIRSVTKFAQRIAELCDAESFCVRDVTYSDAKTVKGYSNFPEQFADINGLGDLKDSAMAYIAENCLDEIIRVTQAASIFTKPLSYSLERERRFQFSFSKDIVEPLFVQDSSLSDLIEVVT